MIRVITLDREYGSGGPAIAQRLADRLGWALWDERLTREIARVTECDPAVVAGREERGDPMYYRLFKSFLRGSFEGSLQAQRLKPVDADRILEVTGHVVRGAGAAGSCVIVGRGSAYFLRDRADAYHVFIYAPFDEKIRRERRAGRSAAEASQLVETVDRERAAFIKKYFDKEWPDRQLYHLMINSELGDERVVQTILAGIATLEN